MNKIYLLMFIGLAFLCSCSDDESEMSIDFAEEIIGGWQLNMIRVAGADCTAVFGADVPEMYLADEEGCARPTEILGNALRCVNVEFMANGVGMFLWSEITEREDEPINYTITNDEIEYCFDGSFCSGSFKLVGNQLESATELRLDQDCSAVFVLRRK